MLIKIPPYTERFGAVRLSDVQHIIELEGGRDSKVQWKNEPKGVARLTYDELTAIEEQMAVVVPIKNEKLRAFEGVLSAIPHGCLIIVISNSNRKPADRFGMEIDTVRQFQYFAQRPIVVIHQKDKIIGNAFKEAGYHTILSPEGVVRDGKGEGMLVGLAIAQSFGKQYVGFVDSDNYVPGSVHEYIKAFCAGFQMANSPYSMVRISWPFKPKPRGSALYFRKAGRSSEHTNRFINLLISVHTNFDTEIVKTANAGDHAISMKLAERMQMASGYAVEPFQLVHLLENYGGMLQPEFSEIEANGIDVLQIQTRNPHIHEDKDDDHTNDMLLDSLGTIFHSRICNEDLREGILEFLYNQQELETTPPKPVLIPPLISMDQEKFKKLTAELIVVSL
ncbi:MAG: mannosyl-3-phosphoglycerate synthase [bacterium]